MVVGVGCGTIDEARPDIKKVIDGATERLCEVGRYVNAQDRS